MRVPPESTVALSRTPSSHFVPATLDAPIAHIHARSMDSATLAALDGTPIVRRPRRPIGIGRTAVLAMSAMAITVDLAMRLLFVLPLWSDFASEGVLSMTLTGMVAGAVTLLV